MIEYSIVPGNPSSCRGCEAHRLALKQTFRKHVEDGWKVSCDVIAARGKQIDAAKLFAPAREMKGAIALIRAMVESDWKRVAEIYEQGLENGTATFNTECPSFEEWDKGHLEECRFVYEQDGTVLGWVAVSPTSSRCAYKGCVEMSVYVDQNHRGHGVGTSLVKELIVQAEKAGYWSIYSAIISINKASIALHKKCGFREIGYREKIAKDRFGVWQNTTLMEYRSACE